MWLRSIEKLTGKCYNDSHVGRMLLYNGIVQSYNTCGQIISKKNSKNASGVWGRNCNTFVTKNNSGMIIVYKS